MDSIEEVAYSQASRTLSMQEASIESARARSAQILAGAAVATAFLGGQGLSSSDGFPVLAWLAMSAFFLVVSLVTYNLWPREFEFELNANTILDPGWADREMPEVYRHLAGFMEGEYGRNKPKLDKMLTVLSASCLALGLELALWVALIAQR